MRNNTIVSQQHQGRNIVSYWAFCLNILRFLKLIFTAMYSCAANRFPPCSPTDALYWNSKTRSQNIHARWIDVQGLSTFAATRVNYLLSATQYTFCFVHTSMPRSSIFPDIYNVDMRRKSGKHRKANSKQFVRTANYDNHLNHQLMYSVLLCNTLYL